MKTLAINGRRGLMFEKRKFIDSAAEELTLSEALRMAVDALRETGGGDALAEQAARMLDKKAIKLRAKETAAIAWPEYCLCGNGKAEGARFCLHCFSAIPTGLWIAFHTAPLDEMGEAYREIEEFVKARRPRSGRDGR